MLAPAGHVTTAAAALLVWYTHAVEYSDGELATERDTEEEREGDAAAAGEREPLLDSDPDCDALTLKPPVGDGDVDGDGEPTKHCTYSRKFVEPPQPQPVQLGASCVPGTMEHELRPRHDVLTTAPLPAAPKHVPCANGPDGHDPVGLP